jgi:hypothetical protein
VADSRPKAATGSSPTGLTPRFGGIDMMINLASVLVGNLIQIQSA